VSLWRHWYSTLVDLLTTRREDRETHAWLWDAVVCLTEAVDPNSQRVKLEICKIPVSLLQFFRAHAKAQNQFTALVGEIGTSQSLRAAENGRLAERLINQLHEPVIKFVKLAFAGAIVPTGNISTTLSNRGASWPRYGTPLPRFAERPEIDQPTTTYNDLYKEFFPHADSRSGFSDYGTVCMNSTECWNLFATCRQELKSLKKRPITLKKELKTLVTQSSACEIVTNCSLVAPSLVTQCLQQPNTNS